MTQLQENFRAEELCSRKLWELVEANSDSGNSDKVLREAVKELAARRHYLAQLEQMGRLQPGN